MAELNAQFRQWLDTVANARRDATTGRIVLERFAEEKPRLAALCGLNEPAGAGLG